MVITAIDGVAVPGVDDLRKQMEGRKPGSPIRLTVRDGKGTRVLNTKLTTDPQTPGRAIIGVLGVHDAPPRAKLPIKVTISPRGLGRGPSAGLAFALEVYDALTGHRLAKGRRIAVTGTIGLDGKVGPIGGVHQKVIGAARKGSDLVLVPLENAADARAAAPGRIKVVAVGTFRQALAALGVKAAENSSRS
jgi:PDZ domain-containing protein